MSLRCVHLISLWQILENVLMPQKIRTIHSIISLAAKQNNLLTIKSLQEFVKELRMRPLNRHYFVLQTNPGEQFYLFTSLAGWLIRKSGRTFDPPQEFDDPNTTITNILDIVRQMGVSIDFAPSKLKQGFGEQAIFVLDRLSDETLR